MKNTPNRSQTSRSYLHRVSGHRYKRAWGWNAPICAPEKCGCTGDRVHLTRVRLDPDAAPVLHAEQVVDNLEPLVSLREVHAADVHAGLVLALRVITEEGEHGDNGGRGNVEGKLVLEHRELLDVLREALDEVGAVGVELFSRLRVLGQRRVRGGGLRERGRRGCWSSVGHKRERA